MRIILLLDQQSPLGLQPLTPVLIHWVMGLLALHQEAHLLVFVPPLAMLVQSIKQIIHRLVAVGAESGILSVKDQGQDEILINLALLDDLIKMIGIKFILMAH